MDELNLHFANFNLCFELVGFEKINSDLTYWGSASNLISFISSNNE